MTTKLEGGPGIGLQWLDHFVSKVNLCNTAHLKAIFYDFVKEL